MNSTPDLVRRAATHPVVRLVAVALLRAAASQLEQPGGAAPPARRRSRACAGRACQAR